MLTLKSPKSVHSDLGWGLGFAPPLDSVRHLALIQARFLEGKHYIHMKMVCCSGPNGTAHLVMIYQGLHLA